MAGRKVAPLVGVLGIASCFFPWGCAAVYPEIKTPVRQVEVSGFEHIPEDLYYIYFEGAFIPPRTRDGREWAGDGPDPYAKFLVDGDPLVVTKVQSGTTRPTWPKQKPHNHRIASDARITLEMWDANAFADHPLCHQQLGGLSALRDRGGTEIRCDSGARLRLAVEPPKTVLGVGFYYEVRGTMVRVTRVLDESPAARAGVDPGDKFVEIQGKPTSKLDPLTIRSLINKHVRSGLDVVLLEPGGKRREVTLKEGAMYPLRQDAVQLPEKT